MRNLPAVAAVACAVMLITSTSWAFVLYWADCGERPECIVIGSMQEPLRDAFEEEDPGRRTHPDSRLMRTYDAGTIAIDEVLLGDTTLTSVPVVWFTGCRFDPPIQHVSVSCEDTEQFRAGDRRIWVVWRIREHAEGFRKDHHWFQALDESEREKVIREIGESLCRPKNPPRP